ncbi:MAG: DUF3046 domain-containing protein [Phycicoccus sp.]|nr:DUF3046 domain-containing protein [Phycicoccus sp.]
MRLSRFWDLMDEEFGEGYSRSLAGRHVLGSLGGRTALQALDDNVAPREVWLALCDDMDVPEERRFGKDVRGSSRG